MPGWKRFWYGGCGAFLPLLVTLLAVDLSAVIDNPNKFSVGVYVGSGIRYAALFVLGGMVAWLNTDEFKPIKLVQIGIAAPALIASYVNSPPHKTAATTSASTPAHTFRGVGIVSTAYAGDDGHALDKARRIIVAESFLSDVVRGATNSFPAIENARHRLDIESKAARSDIAERPLGVDARSEDLRRMIDDAHKSAEEAAAAAGRAAREANRAASEQSPAALEQAKASASNASFAAQKVQFDIKALESALPRR
jgi:hypothetical protein